jgi:Cu(I)/Ag(I) efflux system membrane protein CusA/SilA
VEVVTDLRPLSALIERAVTTSRNKLLEEFIVRGAGVRAVPVPPALGTGGHHHAAGGHRGGLHGDAYQGINANIMSLGGIAIAIGAMVDAAVVMIENAHKHLEAWQERIPASPWIGRGAVERGD